MPTFPTLTAKSGPDFYLLSRHGARVGSVFRVAGGWASVSAIPRRWHRSAPFPTAAEAAEARWGEAGRMAVELFHRETSEVA